MWVILHMSNKDSLSIVLLLYSTWVCCMLTIISHLLGYIVHSSKSCLIPKRKRLICFQKFICINIFIILIVLHSLPAHLLNISTHQHLCWTFFFLFVINPRSKSRFRPHACKWSAPFGYTHVIFLKKFSRNVTDDVILLLCLENCWIMPDTVISPSQKQFYFTWNSYIALPKRY